MPHCLGLYTAEKMYKEAYSIKYNWGKILLPDVLEFHTLVVQQIITPLNWQMGTTRLPVLWVQKHMITL